MASGCYGEWGGSNFRVNRGSTSSSWHNHRPRLSSSTHRENYHNNNHNSSSNQTVWNSAGSRGRLDSSSSSDTSLGKGRKKRSHRPRGCRGGGSRRNRRAQRAAAAVAEAALNEDNIRGEAKKPAVHGTLHHRNDNGDHVTTMGNPDHGRFNSLMPLPQGNTLDRDNHRSLLNHRNPELTLADDVFRRREDQQPSSDHAIPALQSASSLNSSCSSSNSSENEGRRDIDLFPSLPPSDSVNGTTLLSLTSENSQLLTLQSAGASSFDILPTMPRKDNEDKFSGTACNTMSALPPRARNDVHEYNEFPASESNPYSLMHASRENTASNGAKLPNDITTPAMSREGLKLVPPSKSLPVQRPILSPAGFNNTTKAADSNQDAFRAMRIKKQQQMLSGGGSLFATSPRSFLMGYRATAINKGVNL